MAKSETYTGLRIASCVHVPSLSESIAFSDASLYAARCVVGYLSYNDAYGTGKCARFVAVK